MCSVIEPISMLEQGFVKLGLATSKLAEVIQRECTNHLMDVYEFKTINNEVWMRSKERRTGKIIDCIYIIAEVDSRNNLNAEWINDIDPYYNDKPKVTQDLTHQIRMMRDLISEPIHKQIYQSFLALFLTSPSHRQVFLRDHYLPWFFERFPEGKILVLGNRSSYERRLAPLRWGYVLSIYDEDEIEKLKQIGFPGFELMSGLHHIGTVNVWPYIAAVANLFFPYSGIEVLRDFGYCFILLTNEKQIINRGNYPRSRAELKKFSDANLLAGDRPDFSRPPTSDLGWLGRYRPEKAFNSSEYINLFYDVIPRLNRFFRLRLDLTNYRNQDEIDFIGAFEKFYTLDRITLELNKCQCADDGYVARTTLFNILDKLSEIASNPGDRAERLFRGFFTKRYRDDFLISQLKTYVDPFGNYFVNETIKVYDKLYEELLSKQELWMSYRRTSQGIYIRDWDENNKRYVDLSQPLSEDDFIGRLIRVIRNTHHGYISSKSNNKWIRSRASYLSMHTCSLPDSFTAISQYIWLAVLNCPEASILADWISDKTLKDAVI